jgi:hypothetical protein
MRSKMLISAIWLACTASSILPTVSRAATATVYSYSGNSFLALAQPPFDSTMSISGSFTMPDALAPNQSYSFITPSNFSFSDGLSSTFNPVTNLNASLVIFQFIQTDALGNISAWFIQVAAGDYTVPGQQTNTVITANNFDVGVLTVCSQFVGSTCTDISNSPSAVSAEAPGTWSFAPVATPVPATLPLFATGLGGLSLLGWRRKRKGRAATLAIRPVNNGLLSQNCGAYDFAWVTERGDVCHAMEACRIRAVFCCGVSRAYASESEHSHRFVDH